MLSTIYLLSNLHEISYVHVPNYTIYHYMLSIIYLLSNLHETSYVHVPNYTIYHYMLSIIYLLSNFLVSTVVGSTGTSYMAQAFYSKLFESENQSSL